MRLHPTAPLGHLQTRILTQKPKTLNARGKVAPRGLLRDLQTRILTQKRKRLNARGTVRGCASGRAGLPGGVAWRSGALRCYSSLFLRFCEPIGRLTQK